LTVYEEGQPIGPHLRGWLGQHAALRWFWSKQMKAQTP
jgi:hypothetical protein